VQYNVASWRRQACNCSAAASIHCSSAWHSGFRFLSVMFCPELISSPLQTITAPIGTSSASYAVCACCRARRIHLMSSSSCLGTDSACLSAGAQHICDARAARGTTYCACCVNTASARCALGNGQSRPRTGLCTLSAIMFYSLCLRCKLPLHSAHNWSHYSISDNSHEACSCLFIVTNRPSASQRKRHNPLGHKAPPDTFTTTPTTLLCRTCCDIVYPISCC